MRKRWAVPSDDSRWNKAQYHVFHCRKPPLKRNLSRKTESSTDAVPGFFIFLSIRSVTINLVGVILHFALCILHFPRILSLTFSPKCGIIEIQKIATIMARVKGWDRTGDYQLHPVYGRQRIYRQQVKVPKSRPEITKIFYVREQEIVCSQACSLFVQPAKPYFSLFFSLSEQVNKKNGKKVSEPHRKFGKYLVHLFLFTGAVGMALCRPRFGVQSLRTHGTRGT